MAQISVLISNWSTFIDRGLIRLMIAKSIRPEIHQQICVKKMFRDGVTNEGNMSVWAV